MRERYVRLIYCGITRSVRYCARRSADHTATRLGLTRRTWYVTGKKLRSRLNNRRQHEKRRSRCEEKRSSYATEEV